MLAQFDPSQIEDEALRQQFIVLVNWLEKALAENRQLKAEIAALKDENTRLKGGQGRPPLAGGKSMAKNDDPLAEFKQRKPPATYPFG
jgi:cell division protein FtsB